MAVLVVKWPTTADTLASTKRSAIWVAMRGSAMSSSEISLKVTGLPSHTSFLALASSIAILMPLAESTPQWVSGPVNGLTVPMVTVMPSPLPAASELEPAWLLLPWLQAAKAKVMVLRLPKYMRDLMMCIADFLCGLWVLFFFQANQQ